MSKPDAVEPTTVHNAMTPDETPELRQLYADFEAGHMTPLWTQIGNLMQIGRAHV